MNNQHITKLLLYLVFYTDRDFRRSHLYSLTKAKPDDPKQTLTHDPAPTNLEYGPLGLTTKNDNVCETE